MKTVKAYQVIGLAALVFSGSVLADQANAPQNIARRAVTAQPVNATADQAWEGASLQMSAAEQKQQAVRPFSLQYVSRRSTI